MEKSKMLPASEDAGDDGLALNINSQCMCVCEVLITKVNFMYKTTLLKLQLLPFLPLAKKVVYIWW